MIQFQNNDITVFESALYKTTSTVIQTEDLVLVVDPNWLPHEVKRIKNHVEEIKNDRPVFLLFTHSDYDHIIGYRAFPDAKVIASKALLNNPKWEECLMQIFEFDEGFYIQRNYEIQYPFDAEVVVQEEGQQYTYGNTKLTFYMAPGHNADGIFTIVEPLGVFLAGDYLSDVEFPFIYQSSWDYEDTLDKIENIIVKHRLKMTVPGHGNICYSNGDLMNRQFESIEYIKALRTSITQNRRFNSEVLWSRFIFRKGMEKYHEENIKLISKEVRDRRG